MEVLIFVLCVVSGSLIGSRVIRVLRLSEELLIGATKWQTKP